MKLLHSLGDLFEYGMLLRIPLLVAATVAALPIFAFRTSARALLRGLFDVSPLSLVGITLAASCVGGIVSDSARIIYRYSYLRLADLPAPIGQPSYLWLVVTLAVSLPVILTALIFSARQNGSYAKRLIWIAGTLLFSLLLQAYAAPALRALVPVPQAASLFEFLHLGKGYLQSSSPNGVNPLPDHLGAAAGFGVAFAIYLGLGVYAFFRLGKRHVVPALCSLLMVLMLVCSSLSALSFLLDVRHIPVLLVVLACGLIGAQSNQSDYFYRLLQRSDLQPAPSPKEVVNRPGSSKRIILVAANGGGIQASAWTAQVLQGLQSVRQDFVPALKLISSVSGGSVGAAYFLYSLDNEPGQPSAAEAAARSSIDEVAWGLAWPDLVRSVLPWICGHLIGRGRALEKAWCLNAGNSNPPLSSLDSPLSGWNAKVRQGVMPAVIMNATIAETGERLLLGTTRLDIATAIANARVDAAEMHRINGDAMDVGIVTAARLSATFPYVTPASRSDAKGPRPHIVDGGYYDNYGMSSLVEWLDEALKQTDHVDSVLVLQLHGAPVLQSSGNGVAPHEAKNRGWFYQLYAPLTTLAAVRSAGQVAHNNLELQQLQEKWFASAKRIPIHSVTFEFPGENAPLSWHLTAAEKQSIRDKWNDPNLSHCKEQVRQFLSGNDEIECPCPACRVHSQQRFFLRRRPGPKRYPGREIERRKAPSAHKQASAPDATRRARHG